jgi:hypothetical protein
MAGKSGGTAHGSEAERRALTQGMVDLMIEAMGDKTIRLNVVNLADRAHLPRTALTHRNADIHEVFKHIRDPFLQDDVDRLRTQRDDFEAKLAEAKQLIEVMQANADLSARVIRALELRLDSVTQDGVTGIDAYRAKKRIEGLPNKSPDG